MKPVDYFSRDVHTFWATTFQFELKLFDQFLLRRLGNAPLNSVVLVRRGRPHRDARAADRRRPIRRRQRKPPLRPARDACAQRRAVSSQDVTLREPATDRPARRIGQPHTLRTRPGSETFAEFDASIEADQPVFRAWAPGFVSWSRLATTPSCGAATSTCEQRFPRSSAQPNRTCSSRTARARSSTSSANWPPPTYVSFTSARPTSTSAPMPCAA